MNPDTTVADGRETADGENPVDDGDGTESLSEAERLEAEIARLEATNDRLRAAYAHTKQIQYRQTALGLLAVGGLAALGGLLLPSARTVLFALAGTGGFLGVLTYFLAPEQFLPASVGREVYGEMATTQERIVSELGLCDERLYVSTGESVCLYVPQTATAPVPDRDALSETFVVSSEGRGVVFQPTGQALFEEFERALSGSLATTPAAVGSQLSDALVEQFELVASLEHSATGTADSGELTVGVLDSAYGSLDTFDHPVVSFLGVGVARGLETTVEVSIDHGGNDRVDAVVTCRWPYEATETGDSTAR